MGIFPPWINVAGPKKQFLQPPAPGCGGAEVAAAGLVPQARRAFLELQARVFRNARWFSVPGHRHRKAGASRGERSAFPKNRTSLKSFKFPPLFLSPCRPSAVAGAAACCTLKPLIAAVAPSDPPHLSVQPGSPAEPGEVPHNPGLFILLLLLPSLPLRAVPAPCAAVLV